jgi:hypothetical protein
VVSFLSVGFEVRFCSTQVALYAVVAGKWFGIVTVLGVFDCSALTPAAWRPLSSHPKWPTESKIRFYMFSPWSFPTGCERVARILHVTHLATVCLHGYINIKAEITRVHCPAITLSHPLFLCQQGAPTHITTTSSHYAAVCAAVVIHQHDGVSGATRYYPIVTRPINPHYPHSTP